ncbi:MAG TPA: rhodanese-like domain-containing protein [Kiloniellaceae bacterium]
MRWVISAILLACALAAGAMSPAAGQATVAEETPTQLEGVQVVAPEELRPLLNQGVTVYDLRKKASYADGHVPGALSAAEHYDAANNALDVDMLGPDRSSAMVFYSHGSTGWKSYHAAKQAAAAGYKNVMWMRGGYADWAAGNHPIAR